MSFRPLATIFLIVIGLVHATDANGQVSEAPSFDDWRLEQWQAVHALLEYLEKARADEAPGMKAWLEDFREQTKGMGKETPAASWPKVDPLALIDRNPNFWRMRFEVVPGDPTMTALHAVLLS